MKKNLLLLFGTILFCLITLEIVLRIFGVFAPARFLCYHPIMGMSYCANTEGWFVKGASKNYLKINSDGLLDKEYPIPRVPGKLRMAVLGDSFTSAEAIQQEKKFHSLWEERLPGMVKKPVEVINFGVGGTGTWQQLQMYHLKARKYRPDLTVLVFFWGNDVENNALKLKEKSLNPLLGEYPTESTWRKLLVKRKNFNKWLWNHVAAYQFLRERYNSMELRIKFYLRPDYMKGSKVAPDKKIGPPGKGLPVAAKPGNAMMDTQSVFDDKLFMDSEGWQVTKKLILKLRDEASGIGSRLVVIHFPGQYQLRDHPPLPLEEFNAFLTENHIKNIGLFENFLALDVETLNKNYIPRDGHFNEDGHEAFFKYTSDFLARELMNENSPL